MKADDLAFLCRPEVRSAFFDEMARRNMARVKEDPEYFRSVLMIDTGLGERASFGACMDDWQRQDFAAMDPAWLTVVGRGKPGMQVFFDSYYERGRGHSKTNDIAVAVLWALLSSPRKLRGVAASGSKEQAGFVRDAIDTLLRLNKWLGELIQVNRFEVKNVRTGSHLMILAAAENTSYGHTPDFVIIDELTHWDNEGFWTSLASSAGKRPGCVMQIISNAGNGRGKPLEGDAELHDLGGSWQWRVREEFRTGKRSYFHRLEGCVASWITPEQLAIQQRRLAPTAYSRLWNNQWQLDGANVLPWEDIEACCVLAGERTSGDGLYCTIGAIDLSQTKHFSALVIFGINLDRRRVELVLCKRWMPSEFPNGRISLRHIRTEIREYAQRFNMVGLAYDPHQGELLAEDLEKVDHIPCYRQNFNPKEKHIMATTCLNTLREHGVDLYRDPDLIRDLMQMRVLEKTQKRLTIEAPEGDDVGHCDVGTAFVLGLPWALGTLERTLLAA
jgi:hypothetical protein